MIMQNSGNMGPIRKKNHYALIIWGCTPRNENFDGAEFPHPQGSGSISAALPPKLFLFLYCAISAPASSNPQRTLPLFDFSIFPSLFSCLSPPMNCSVLFFFFYFFLRNLSGAISSLVNTCCDMSQVGETIDPGERNTSDFLPQQCPMAYFPLCVSVGVFVQKGTFVKLKVNRGC